MASYKITLTEKANKSLVKIKDHTISKRLFRKIESLGKNPAPSGVRRIMGSDMDYRIRMGDYRIIYQVLEEEKSVHVIAVGHRKDIYR